jgi:hypothetical protein
MGLPDILRESFTFLYVYHVRFEVFTVVTMKNGVFWDVLTRATQRNIPEDTILYVYYVRTSQQIHLWTSMA